MIGVMKRYLDDVYCGLDCLVSINEVTWYKDGDMIAGVNRNNPCRLRLAPTEFHLFTHMFSLPWKGPKDDIVLLEMILPYLKFNGGSPAIPVLEDMGFIDELDHIALPSNWK